MKLHKEAFPTVFFAFIVFALFNTACWLLLNEFPFIQQILFYASLVLLILVFYFFRVPFHVTPVGKQVIVSPAHGKVVEIVDEREEHYFHQPLKRVSIFMSPLNIHCNYVPIHGRVSFAEHFPGKYLVAFHPKSSDLNEHTFFAIENETISIGVKQIAGFMARRIVPYLKEGMQVNQNDELGFIKFGSRVDVFFPLHTKIAVQEGDTVKGGVTTLAEY